MEEKNTVYVISDPTLFEIREMLDAVALDNDLSRILPTPKGMSLAEWVSRGWCYLWYDAETLEPLGYTIFEFQKKHERYPFFHFASTRFIKLWQIHKIVRAMKAVMRNAFKNNVRAYILSERISEFAECCGFRRCKRNKHYLTLKG